MIFDTHRWRIQADVSRPGHPLQKSKNKNPITSDFMHGISLFYCEN